MYDFYMEPTIIEERRDDKGRLCYQYRSDGYECSMEYDEEFHNGEVPYYIVELMHGHITYERQGNTTILRDNLRRS